MIPLDVWQQQFESVYGPGKVMLGSDMSNEQAMQHAVEHAPAGKYCIVRSWVWTDFIVSDDQHLELLQAQVQPAIVYANSVVFDSRGRFEPGEWVRTTMLKSFSDGFHFQTENTTYLLLGIGYRRVVGLNSTRGTAACELK